MDGGAFSLPVPDSKEEKYSPHKGEKCYIGIRPEHLYDIQFVKEYDPRNIIKARVELIETVGAFVILHWQIAGAGGPPVSCSGLS